MKHPNPYPPTTPEIAAMLIELALGLSIGAIILYCLFAG